MIIVQSTIIVENKYCSQNSNEIKNIFHFSLNI